MSFSDVVEAIKALSVEEKQEVQSLLQQYLREERRLEIYAHFRSRKLKNEVVLSNSPPTWLNSSNDSTTNASS